MLTSNAPGPILRDEMLEARGRTAFPLDRGQTLRVVDVDGQQVADHSVTIFMNVPIGDGKIGIEKPLSKAGDLVDLRAERHLLVAISNCPQERNPCNAYSPARLRMVVLGPPSA